MDRITAKIITKCILSFGHTTLHFEYGHTMSEYERLFSHDQNLFDFSIDDIITEAIEADNDIVYWMINNRLFETTITID